MTELFETIERAIPGFENYTINCWGRVKNISTGKLLKPCVDGRGYYKVDLYKNGKKKSKKVHRLLGEIFLKCEKHQQIDHKNGNRTDNHMNNLRICSRQENNRNRKNVKGVYHEKKGNNEYWRAQIKYNGKNYGKYFEYTTEGKHLAYRWRINREIELFKEFANRV